MRVEIGEASRWAAGRAESRQQPQSLQSEVNESPQDEIIDTEVYQDEIQVHHNKRLYQKLQKPIDPSIKDPSRGTKPISFEISQRAPLA